MAKAALSPSSSGGKRRMSSPPGRSILITSAPASASISDGQRPRQQRGEIEDEKAGERLHDIHLNNSGGSVPVFTIHITLVSVTTDTSVPTSTALEACSTQASYWRANTNTLSAGGSAAISTAV